VRCLTGKTSSVDARQNEVWDARSDEHQPSNGADAALSAYEGRILVRYVLQNYHNVEKEGACEHGQHPKPHFDPLGAKEVCKFLDSSCISERILHPGGTNMPENEVSDSPWNPI
jgi:hypothetical protein